MPIGKITEDYIVSMLNKIEEIQFQPAIYKAREQEMDEIAHLYHRSWLTSNVPFRKITLDDFQRIYNDPHMEFLVAKLHGIYVGFVILALEGDEQEYGAIVALGIKPRYQRRGIGTALGYAAWNHFEQKKVKELRCEVHIRNERSLNFIKSLGFEEF